MRTRSRSIALGLVLAVAAGGLGAAAASSPDEVALLALHEKVMRAHRQSDVAILLEDEAADNVVASRGEILRPSIEDRKSRLSPYLSSTRFEEYADATEPVVKVSADGTLGWVIVQVRAKGIQTAADGTKTPIEFVSAWIELYEKRGGRWLRVGNVSNFKP